MLTTMKKRLALLLAVTTLSAVTVLVPSTATAAASKNPSAGTTTDPYEAPASTTAMTACPGNSAAAAGFTDTTSTDVDCIKMFGITTGKTATTYDPTGTISRQDMARFIHRMFVPTGMAAAGATAVPAFTDIAHVDAGGTAAINALASHGITLGTTATTFSPDSNVTREQMALFLYRFAGIVGAYDDATPSGLTMSIANGAYNYADIASTSFEAMEAIIGLYNLGVTGETCTAATLSTCGTTYRPSDDITRAEMASMLTALLGHTNARPAGVTVQTITAVSAASEATSISCRKADFSVNQNVLVDAFHQVRNDTSATTQAASKPFVAVTNVTNTSTGGVTGTGTVGTMDTGDKLCGVKGNVAGVAQTLTAASTGRWWVWTADQGTVYVDGTTTAFLFEASVPAGATTTYATTATHAWDKTQATANNFSSITNVTATDGSNTYQGTSRTLTTTLTGSTSAAVVDGYTVKYVDKVVNYGGGTGNQTITYNTTYVASANGKASLTVTCGADHLPLASNAVNDGAPAAAEYYESHEITVTFQTATGNGWPVGGSDPTDAGLMNNSTMNLSCDDVPRAYPGGDSDGGSETLTVGKNYADVSAAGTLASITATAYDQYGVGIAGVTARFDSVTATNAADTAIAVGAATERATLTTGADGTATLTAVVCTANGYVSWAVHSAGTMDAMAARTAGTTASGAEGTVIYCTTPGTDTITTQTVNTNRTDVAETQTLTFYNNGTATDPTAATFVITYAGEACDASAHNATNADIANDCNTNANLAGASVTIAGDAKSLLFTFPANTGDHPLITCTGAGLYGGAGGTCTAVETTKGVSGVTFDFIDDDLSNNSFVTVKTVKDRQSGANSTAGLAVVTTSYQRWTYDSSDNFATGTALANQGATEAAFETSNAAIGNFTTNVALTYRTGATTSGVSHFSVGN